MAFRLCRYGCRTTTVLYVRFLLWASYIGAYTRSSSVAVIISVLQHETPVTPLCPVVYLQFLATSWTQRNI